MMENDWLWKNWLPKGEITLLVTPPGCGASYLALEIANRVANGSGFPLGDDPCYSAKVIYVDADEMAPVMLERLDAWAANLDHIYLVQSRGQGDVIDLNKTYYQDTLIEMVNALAPSLIVVDSLQNAVLNIKSSVQVEKALLFLQRLAEDAHSALLVVQRTILKRKEKGVTSLSDISGTSEITYIPKIVWGMDIDGDVRHLKVIKNVLNGEYPMFQYRMVTRNGHLDLNWD